LDAIGFDWRSYIEQWPEKHGHISLGKNMIGAYNIIGVETLETLEGTLRHI
jgi:hypothetical protein